MKLKPKLLKPELLKQEVFKTEVGDQTQYLAHEFNDNTIRFILTYSGLVRAELLQKAAEILVGRIVVLHSSFHVGTWGTKWIVNESYPADRLVVAQEVGTEEDVEKEAKKAAVRAMDYTGAVQISCHLFYHKSKGALVLRVGHMCADGRDAEYLLLKLVELYNALASGRSTDSIVLKNGNRSIDQCYSQNPDMLSIDLQKFKPGKFGQVKSSYTFHTEEDGGPCMVDCTIAKEDISSCRKLVAGSTVNDVILAAYCRAYIRQMGMEKSDPVGISTMIDLRKYIRDGHSDGVTNLSGPIDVRLLDGIGADFKQTLQEVVRQMDAVKKDHTAGLDMILVVKKCYGLMPFPLIVQIARKVYGSLSIGLTNLGNLPGSSLQMDGCSVKGLYFAGPLKKKPALQISASGLDGNVRLCILSECTKDDQRQLEELLAMLSDEISQMGDGGWQKKYVI